MAQCEYIFTFSSFHIFTFSHFQIFKLVYSIILEKRKTKRLTLDVALICIALFWIAKGDYAIAVVILLFAAIGFYTNRRLVATFSDDNIFYPSFISKTYSWSEISNVILKDDVLTIDLKSNKLLQTTLPVTSSEGIDEKEFNAFCQQQLSRHR